MLPYEGVRRAPDPACGDPRVRAEHLRRGRAPRRMGRARARVSVNARVRHPFCRMRSRGFESREPGDRQQVGFSGPGIPCKIADDVRDAASGPAVRAARGVHGPGAHLRGGNGERLARPHHRATEPFRRAQGDPRGARAKQGVRGDVPRRGAHRLAPLASEHHRHPRPGPRRQAALSGDGGAAGRTLLEVWERAHSRKRRLPVRSGRLDRRSRRGRPAPRPRAARRRRASRSTSFTATSARRTSS